MFLSTYSPAPQARRAVHAYAETRVNGARSSELPGHALVEMLFEGAQEAIALARGLLKAGDLAGKGSAISRAQAIVGEGLRGSLDLGRGGQIARELDALYSYIETRLTLANLHNDDAALEECSRLLRPVQEAWTQIGTQVKNDR